MTFTEAAAHVLRLVGKPLHYKEITDVAIECSLLSHVGKSPEVTMGARLAAQVKKAAQDNPIVRVKPGVFALGDWDEQTVKEGLADRTPAIERMRKAEEAAKVAAEEKSLADDSAETSESDMDAGADQDSSELSSSSGAHIPAVAPMAVHREIDDEDVPPDEVEQRRAELSASATALFESEDDDDQPIFGTPEPIASQSESEGDRADGKRRRRRRRGRGRRDEEGEGEMEAVGGGDDLPRYTVSDAEPQDLPLPLPEEERESRVLTDLEGGEDLSGSLSDALEVALGRYDRGRGPVAAQNLADSLRRKYRGDLALNGAGVVAAAYADNLAAERSRGTPRFRISGSKIALTAWSLDRRALDRHRALSRATEQVRESTVRALSDELRRLPQRAVGELITVLLDRMGVVELSSVRRPGAHGSELHLTGIVRSGGLDLRTGGVMRMITAIMIRRDGKDIGRERVTEIRGALHHYGPAVQGWLISTGQVLSGAREESQAQGASPVTLSGRHELAELLVAYGVGVRTHQVEIPVLDVELFENLQGR